MNDESMVKSVCMDADDICLLYTSHLTGYSLTREGAGLSIKRRAGFEYLHKAPHFRHKLAEPFVVTAPYLEEEQDCLLYTSRCV